MDDWALPAIHRYLTTYAEENDIDLSQPPEKGEWDYSEPEPVTEVVDGITLIWSGGDKSKCPDGYLKLVSRETIKVGDLFRQSGGTIKPAEGSIEMKVGNSAIYRPIHGVTTLFKDPRPKLEAIEHDGKFYTRTDKLEEFLEQAETCTKEHDSPSTSKEPLTGDPEVCTEESDWRKLREGEVIREGDCYREGTGAMVHILNRVGEAYCSKTCIKLYRPLYRKLGPEEIVQEGDEWKNLSDSTDEWGKVLSIITGKRAFENQDYARFTFRRRIEEVGQ